MFTIHIYATLPCFIQLFLNLMNLCYIMHTQSIFHFHNAFTPKRKLLIFDNKQMVKMYKLLRYYS